jgi:Uma2 family endonuclease
MSFGSNAGFTLPNNAVRSPDSAFIRKDQWEKVAKSDRKKFAHICPDFVIELLSESDQLKASLEKMKEWMDNGCQLAWMINPQKKKHQFTEITNQ